VSSAMLIGLTGLNASGKGTVAESLQARGYAYHSLSDAIRDVLAEQGLAPTREHMIEAGRELRRKGGPGALAEQILKKIGPDDNAIIDSIRTPGEVEVLRGHPGFCLIEVTASEPVRLTRITARGRIGDPTELETVRRLEAAELTGDSAGQQLVATAALADAQLPNEGDMDALYAALEGLLESFRPKSA
jgi:dephospho-CoA kinase